MFDDGIVIFLLSILKLILKHCLKFHARLRANIGLTKFFLSRSGKLNEGNFFYVIINLAKNMIVRQLKRFHFSNFDSKLSEIKLSSCSSRLKRLMTSVITHGCIFCCPFLKCHEIKANFKHELGIKIEKEYRYG